MNKKITHTKLAAISLLFIFVFLLTGCQKDSKADEAIGFLFAMFVFLIGTILTGLPAVVLSAVSVSSTKKYIPLLAIIFTALYFVFFVFMFANLGFAADSEITAVFPVVGLLILGLSVVLIIRGFKKRATGYASINDEESTSVLDVIIDGENDDELLD